MKRIFTVAALALLAAGAVQAQETEAQKEQKRLDRQQQRQQAPQQKPQPQQAPARQQPAPQPPQPRPGQRPAQVPMTYPQRPAQARPEAPGRDARNLEQQRQRQQQMQVERQRQRLAQPSQRPQAPDSAYRRSPATDAPPGRTPRADGPQNVRARPEHRDSNRPLDSRPRPQRPSLGRPQRPERPNAERPGARPPSAERPSRLRPAPDRNRPPSAVADRDRRVRPELPKRPDRNVADRTRQRADRPRFDPDRSQALRQRARQHAADRRDRTVRVGRATRRIVRAARYRYPSGYRYRVYRRGERFPSALLLASYSLTNFAGYGLDAPPVGYRWVRWGPDAVLVDLNGYEVMDTRYGVFQEGDGLEASSASADLPEIDPNLPEAFLSGELQLSDGGGAGCQDFYGDDQWLDYVDQAWGDEDWNELAGTVIDSGCESDLSYFLLGLSAEGLELPSASAGYYQRALELFDARFDDNCDAWGDGACRGVDIGAEAEAGLERIYARE